MIGLLKGVLKTGTGAIANVLIGLISIKFMAVMLGPSGTGLFSLIRQLVTTLSTLGFGGQTSIVQGIASKKNEERDNYMRSTFWLLLAGAVLSVLVIEVFAATITTIVFGKSEHDLQVLVRWVALPVFFTHVYIYLKSVLNGFRAIGRLVLVEMFGPFTSLLLVYPTCIFVGTGYTLAFVWLISLAQVAMIVTSIIILKKEGWLSVLTEMKEVKIFREDLRYFIKISGTVFITVMIGTASILFVRATIASHSGLSEAGLFDLAWSLSGNYVGLILASFGTYYAPTLSQIKDKAERAALIRRVMRLSTMLMIPLIVAVIVSKSLLVRTLYSEEYSDSLPLVRWMLIGDYFKITSWVLAIPAIVNLDMRIYFWSETFWFISFSVLSILSIVYFGELEWIGIAFVVLYLAYMIYYLQYVRKVCALKITRDLLVPWLLGFAIVVMASFQNWNNTSVDWFAATLWITSSLLLVFSFLKATEIAMILNKLRSMLKGH